MANTSSAQKKVKVIRKKTAQNVAVKSALKTAIKTFENAPSNENFNFAAKKIDQAANKNIIHKNTAARKKSQLAKKLNKGA